MMTYLFSNLVLSLTVITVIKLSDNTHPRLRFYLCLSALVSWCLPWHLLNQLSLIEHTPQSFSYLVPIIQSMNETQIQASQWVESKPSIIEYWPYLIVFMGLFLALIDGIRHWFALNNLAKSAQITAATNNASVRILASPKIESAFLTGVFKPTIWVNEAHLNSPHMYTIVEHELTHFRQLDHAWTIVIRAIRHFLFWNPIVWILAKQANQLIELSCDAKCAKKLGKTNYLQSLAILLLESHNQQKLVFSQLNSPSKNFNIQRLINLKKDKKMNKNSLLLCSGIALLTAGLASLPVVSQSIDKNETSLTQSTDEGKLVRFMALLSMVGGINNYYIHPDYKDTLFAPVANFNPNDRVGIIKLFASQNIDAKYHDNNIYLAPSALLEQTENWKEKAISAIEDNRKFGIMVSLNEGSTSEFNGQLVAKNRSETAISMNGFDIVLTPLRKSDLISLHVEVFQQKKRLAGAVLGSSLGLQSELIFEYQGLSHSLHFTTKQLTDMQG
jgi:beta-lactamase regulating signal transducer with metallopeptidase domain